MKQKRALAAMALGGLIAVISIFTPASATAPLALPACPAPPPAPTSAPAAPNLRTAVIDDCLTVRGQEMAARVLDTRMAVSVEVNGNGPFRFLVDSGADRSVIGVALAKRLNLPASEIVHLNDVAGASDVGTFLVDTLKIGDAATFAVSAPALPEQFLGAQGIVGVDALADRRIMLDFQNNKITLEDARQPEPEVPGEIVVIGHRRHGQLILTEVRVGKLNVYALIDTGSDMTIGNYALLEKVAGSRHPPNQVAMMLSSVTGRSTPATGVVLPRIQIGGLRINNLPVAFADVAPFALFGMADRPAMLLGTDALRGLKRMSLDFHQYRVRFQLRDNGASPRG
jgi:predicted aspartyl protease